MKSVLHYSLLVTGKRKRPSCEMSALRGWLGVRTSSETILPVPGARVMPCVRGRASVKSGEGEESAQTHPWPVAGRHEDSIRQLANHALAVDGLGSVAELLGEETCTVGDQIDE